MNNFEDILENEVISKNLGIHAVTRTGNNLKEFEYYFNNQVSFMEQFNQSFALYETFPIKIQFYKDPKWKELERFITML